MALTPNWIAGVCSAVAFAFAVPAFWMYLAWDEKWHPWLAFAAGLCAAVALGSYGGSHWVRL